MTDVTGDVHLSAQAQSRVNIAAVEKTLSQLWADVAKSEGQNEILRATTLNLVMHTSNPQHTSGLISEVAQEHPCRAIALEPAESGEPTTTLQAYPTVFCRPAHSTRSQICCEVIMLHAGSEAAARVPAAIQNLLLADLPVYLYHEGDLAPTDPIIRGLGEVTDCVIVDTSTCGTLSATLNTLLTLLETPHFHARIADLTWQRITPWRKALARAFDAVDDRGSLRSIRKVEIVHHKAATQAIWYAAWLISRLGWQIVPERGTPNNFAARSERGLVSIRLREEPDGTPGLRQVSVTADHRLYSVSLFEGGNYIVSTHGPAQALRYHHDSPGTLIGAIIDQGGTDPIYHETLRAALLLAAQHGDLAERAGLIVSENSSSLARLTAAYFVHTAQSAIGRQGRFVVALSGGSTPKTLYELLARPPYRDQIEWAKVHVFWGDERDVPTDHPDSNQHMAAQALLEHVPIPPENIHRLLTGQLPAVEVAARYAQDIRDFFKADPHFDLVLLGLGEDGHTASLFPYSEALRADAGALVVANPIPKLNTTRLTLTVEAINQAENVAFLIAGSGKANILQTVFKGEVQPDQLPAQWIKPRSGALFVLADQAAAAKVADTQ